LQAFRVERVKERLQHRDLGDGGYDRGGNR